MTFFTFFAIFDAKAKSFFNKLTYYYSHYSLAYMRRLAGAAVLCYSSISSSKMQYERLLALNDPSTGGMFVLFIDERASEERRRGATYSAQPSISKLAQKSPRIRPNNAAITPRVAAPSPDKSTAARA